MRHFFGKKLAKFFGEDVNLQEIVDSSAHAAKLLEMDYFSSLLPYRLYDPVTKLYENEHSYGFFFELVPLLGLDANSQKQISALIRDLGDEGSNIQCMIWADPRIDPFLEVWKKPREKMGGIYKKLSEKKYDFFRGQNYQLDVPPRIFRIFFSYSAPRPSENEKGIFLKQLSEKRQKALMALNQFHCVIDSDISDFLDLMSGIVNFEQDTKVNSRKKWYPDTFISNQICLPGGAISVKPDHLEFMGETNTVFKTYEAVDFPDQWSMGLQQELIGDFMSDAHRIPCPFYIHYGIHFPNQDAMATKLSAKAKYLDHQTKSSYINRLVPQISHELEENLFVSRQIQAGEKLVQTRMSVGLWSKPKELIRAETILESLFRKYSFKLQQNKFHHLNELLFSMPMTWGESSKYMKQYKHHMALRTTYTVETANFVSMIGEWWGNSRKGMVFMGRRGQIASWDPFETNSNYNIVVVGASGQGKSVFMQDLMTSELGKGNRVFVLDLGRSFEKLCKILNGQYLFFNETSNLNLNPFHIVEKSSGSENINLFVDMVTSIIATMAMPDEPIDKESKSLLNTAVKLAWEQKKGLAAVDDVIENISQCSYQSELMKGAAESLCSGLKRYTRSGAYSNYFYGTEDINFKSDLVVIETEELKNMPDLQAVIMQIFALNISGQVFMGDREKRSYICIDEGWDLLKSPQMEGFIESMARRLRKYNGALIVGTQSLSDFDRSKGAQAAFLNSNWVVIVGGNAELVKLIQEKEIIPSMDGGLAETLRSMRKVDGKYAEAFIYDKNRQVGSVNRLVLDPFSSMLYSTKAEEFQVVQELAKFGVSVEEGIEWLIKNKDLVRELRLEGYKISSIVAKLYNSSEKSFDLTHRLQKMSVSKQQPTEIQS